MEQSTDELRREAKQIRNLRSKVCRNVVRTFPSIEHITTICICSITFVFEGLITD